MEYTEFLQTKVKTVQDSGFDIQESELNSKLFDFQKYCVRLALKKGRFALFEECGLGKSFQQIEWSYQVSKFTNKPVLILCPLAVSGQTIQEGLKLGYEIKKYSSDVAADQSGIYISNYEQLENINCSIFSGVVLDESSILKTFSGKTKQLIIERFKETLYKLACTATPSPNDILELGNHADFLNIMPSNEMIARWFINDTMNFGGYRLKKHAQSDFWLWVSSWSVMFSNPSDIGFKQDGYNLPDLNIIEKRIQLKNLIDYDNNKLFKEANTNATNFNKALKDSVEERLNLVVDIVNNSNEQFIIWINHNEEGDYLKKHINGAVEVTGSDKPELKEKNLLGFANNEFRVLITKMKIAQYGLNFQNCFNQVFSGITFSFEGIYQAIRRSYRFGQTKEVNIYLLCTENMENVMDIVKRKEKDFKNMQSQMAKATLNAKFQYKNKEVLKMDYEKIIKKGLDWEVRLGDSCELIKEIPDNHFDFSIFSPPFSNLYIYSDSIRDMGNCRDDNEFFEQYKYLVKELYRTMKPNRLVAVHVKNLVNYMNSSEGKSGQRDFRGDNIRLFTECGFSYHSEVTIWKDPVIEMQRTKAHGLLYKQLRKDSTYSRNGMAEYLVIFRKWEDSNTKDFNNPVNWKTHENFELDKWQDYASPVYSSEMSKEDLIQMILKQQNVIQMFQDKIPPHLREVNPVWMDISQTNVLNIKEARDNQDEKHICPLQLDVIHRAVEMWTNPNELVFSPFTGIGSEGFESLKLGRKFLGFELKPLYFEKACKNLESAIQESNQLSLFTV